MKTYFRLLSFAKPIEKYAIPYILYTLLYVLFSTVMLIMLGPLLNTIIGVNVGLFAQAPAHPKWYDISSQFKYYLGFFITNYGRWYALKFVCVVTVVSVVLCNIFRYLSARIMENLRIYTLFNLRRTVFDNVMDMHLGFFNNERKGDIVSKIASDVQVVQFSVTATLQVVFK